MKVVKDSIGKKAEASSSLVAEYLIDRPEDVMCALTSRGYSWEDVMDKICGWSQSVNTILLFF